MNSKKWIPPSLLAYSIPIHNDSRHVLPFENDLDLFSVAIHDSAARKIAEIMDSMQLLKSSSVLKIFKKKKKNADESNYSLAFDTKQTQRGMSKSSKSSKHRFQRIAKGKN